MRIATSVFALVCSVLAASAAELQVPVDNFHGKFNSSNRANGIDLRAKRTKCQTGAKTVCQYTISKAIGVLVSSDEPKGMAKEITVLLASNNPSDAVDGLLAYAALVGLLSPSAAPRERGDLIMSLVKEVELSEEKGTAELDSVKYTLMSVKGMGLWFIATPIDD